MYPCSKFHFKLFSISLSQIVFEERFDQKVYTPMENIWYTFRNQWFDRMNYKGGNICKLVPLLVGFSFEYWNSCHISRKKWKKYISVEILVQIFINKVDKQNFFFRSDTHFVKYTLLNNLAVQRPTFLTAHFLKAKW